MGNKSASLKKNILWALILNTQLNSNTTLLTNTKRKIPKLVQLYVFTSSLSEHTITYAAASTSWGSLQIFHNPFGTAISKLWSFLLVEHSSTCPVPGIERVTGSVSTSHCNHLHYQRCHKPAHTLYKPQNHSTLTNQMRFQNVLTTSDILFVGSCIMCILLFHRHTIDEVTSKHFKLRWWNSSLKRRVWGIPIIFNC